VEEDRSCVVSLSSNPLHIAGNSVSSGPQSNSGLHCGTRTQPWLLEAPAGQRINISLVDFTPADAVPLSAAHTGSLSSRGRTFSSSSQRLVDVCEHPYGYIVDKSAAAASGKRNVSVCSQSMASQKLQHIYLSVSNVVEFVLARRLKENESLSFLVRVEGIATD
jgi:hypothetical protein